MRKSEIQKREELAEYIAAKIFECGNDPGSVCTRIEFKGKSQEGIEYPQGGLIESALAKHIDKCLKEYLPLPEKPIEPDNIVWQRWPCYTHAPMTQEEFKKQYECNFKPVEKSREKYTFNNKVTIIQPFINPRTGIKESIELSGDSCLIDLYKELYNIK